MTEFTNDGLRPKQHDKGQPDGAGDVVAQLFPTTSRPAVPASGERETILRGLVGRNGMPDAPDDANVQAVWGTDGVDGHTYGLCSVAMLRRALASPAAAPRDASDMANLVREAARNAWDAAMDCPGVNASAYARTGGRDRYLEGVPVSPGGAA